MEIRKNITSIFIVPTLKIEEGRRGVLKNIGFINGYVEDKHKDIQYEDSVYLLFKPENIDNFREFLSEEYERTKSIIDDYDYEDGYVVVVYKLNSKFKKDFSLVKEGKYSRTSLEFQELFPKLITVGKGNSRRDEMSLAWRVFEKTEDMIDFWEEKLGVAFNKEMEVWSGFFIENETLDMDKIKELI